jgi:hypothetical protein
MLVDVFPTCDHLGSNLHGRKTPTGLNRLEQEAIEIMNALLMTVDTKLATCKQAFGANERLLNDTLRHYSHRLHKQVLQTQFLT